MKLPDWRMPVRARSATRSPEHRSWFTRATVLDNAGPVHESRETSRSGRRGTLIAQVWIVRSSPATPLDDIHAHAREKANSVPGCGTAPRRRL
jgi:hypothetical protein